MLQPSPPPQHCEHHLLFFRFGFLGICSQGFLRQGGHEERGSHLRASPVPVFVTSVAQCI